MKIKSLKNTHPSIYNRILELQSAQGNKPDDSLDTGTIHEHGNFYWDLTSEGFDVWDKVDNGDFDAWYEHHGLNPRTILVHEPKTFISKVIDILPEILRIAGLLGIAFNFKEIVTENTLIWIWGLAIFGSAELIDITKKIYNDEQTKSNKNPS